MGKNIETYIILARTFSGPKNVTKQYLKSSSKVGFPRGCLPSFQNFQDCFEFDWSKPNFFKRQVELIFFTRRTKKLQQKQLIDFYYCLLLGLYVTFTIAEDLVSPSPAHSARTL
jgi:hypothetical protein